MKEDKLQSDMTFSSKYDNLYPSYALPFCLDGVKPNQSSHHWCFDNMLHLFGMLGGILNVFNSPYVGALGKRVVNK